MAREESASRRRERAVRGVGLFALAATAILLAVPWIVEEPSDVSIAVCLPTSQATAGLSILCGFMARGRALTLTLVVPPLVYLAIMTGVV